MQGKYRREQLGGQSRAQVDQWRLVEKRFTGQHWHDPIAILQQMIDDAEGVGFIRFPGVVPDQSQENPGYAEQYGQRDWIL